MKLHGAFWGSHYADDEQDMCGFARRFAAGNNVSQKVDTHLSCWFLPSRDKSEFRYEMISDSRPGRLPAGTEAAVPNDVQSNMINVHYCRYASIMIIRSLGLQHPPP